MRVLNTHYVQDIPKKRHSWEEKKAFESRWLENTERINPSGVSQTNCNSHETHKKILKCTKVSFISITITLFQVRVILLNWCAWFLRMKKPGENIKPLSCKYSYPKCHLSINSMEMNVLPGHQSSNGNTICGYHAMDNPCCPQKNDLGVKSRKITCPLPEDAELVQKKALMDTLPVLVKILEEVQFIAMRFRKQDEGEEICSEWKFAAAVIDRLCLVAFTLFAIICTFTILMSAPNFIEAVSKDFA